MLEMHVSAGTLRIKIIYQPGIQIGWKVKEAKMRLWSGPPESSRWRGTHWLRAANSALSVALCLQEKKKKQTEIEAKRAEVRKRMEEASKAKKAKKGFMTPERKKKLRVSFGW